MKTLPEFKQIIKQNAILLSGMAHKRKSITMYTLLIHPLPDHLPKVVSIHSNEYPELLMMGYEVKEKGTKKEMELLIENEEN